MNAQDHFKGRFEVEKKFRDVDLALLRMRLTKLDAETFISEGSETDIYLDKADGELARQNRAFVLRELRPSNRVLIISKGPEKDACTAIETTNFAATTELFTGLGFTEVRRVEKRRDVYFVGDCHVTLDVVEPFGCFAEVAIMIEAREELPHANQQIDDVIAKLGLNDSEEEHLSYARMVDRLL